MKIPEYPAASALDGTEQTVADQHGATVSITESVRRAYYVAAPGPIGSLTPNSGAFTTISASGVITSTVLTGTSPFTLSSTTVVPNLNASLLLGGTWAIPGTIGSGTPNTGAFTTISASGVITSTVATGTAPFSVSSTTPVPNLSIGGNAGTATTATSAATVTTTVASGAVGTTQAVNDNSTKIATTAYADTRNPTIGTPTATTTGTSVTVTGIPTWAKRIVITFKGVGTNGTSPKLLQVGSGSVTATGYLGSGSFVAASTAGASTYTTGFGITSTTAADRLNGSIFLHLENLSTNSWSCTGCVSASNQTATFHLSGNISLAGALDRVSITTVNGTDAYAAGEINIVYD